MFKKLLLTFTLWQVSVFSQTTCYETVTLPTDSKLGGGDTQGSVLIGNTYNAGEGPGIYIVADGGYRLYLNGELLAYDNAAGRSRFIPMTFLPGSNAISVMGINGSAAPGILVHIDELHQSYTTNSAWKSKTSAYISDNTWKNKTFDMSQWGAATVQSAGTLTQTPSGTIIAGAAFPSTSTAKWIWSGSSTDVSGIFRFTFDIKAVGFGAATTGGDGGTVVVVDNVTDLVTQATSSTAKVILVKEGNYDCRNYQTQSVCYQTCDDKLTNGGYNGNWVTNGSTCPGTTKSVQRWDRLVWMKSNKSIIGMGRGASLRGIAFYSNSGNVISNVIFRNLKIWDVNPHIVEAGDGISINNASKLWVDHCSFKWISDGNDISTTTECTFSWNRWNGYNEYMCTKRDNYSAMVAASDITYDHIWWDGACGRNPKTYGTANTRIHMINNYHSTNNYYAAESGGSNLLVYIENTHFDSVRFYTVKLNGGVIYCSGNKYDNIGSHQVNWVKSTEPTDAAAKFTVPYTYTLDNVNSVKSICMTYCGTGGKWGAMPLYSETAGLSNKAPTVSVTSPTAGTSLTNPSSVTLTATATDTDGSIAKVTFYSGTTKLGEDATAPYSYTLTALTSCTYSILAEATDNSGKVLGSWPVTFTVTVPTQKAILTKQGAGSSSQTITIGSAIVPFSFAWDYANTVTVTGMPTGIVVDINTTTKIVSISGIPSQTGTFNYTVSTVGGSPDSSKSGKLIVNVVTDVDNHTATSAYEVYPNPSKGGFIFNAPEVQTVEIFDSKGKQVGIFKDVKTFEYGEHLPAGSYVLKTNGPIIKWLKE
ncbi:MAG: Ig-like domain-containing protein [Cytophagales bacterium]